MVDVMNGRENDDLDSKGLDRSFLDSIISTCFFKHLDG